MNSRIPDAFPISADFGRHLPVLPNSPAKSVCSRGGVGGFGSRLKSSSSARGSHSLRREPKVPTACVACSQAKRSEIRHLVYLYILILRMIFTS